MKTNELIEKGNYDSAVQLIKEGIQLAEEKTLHGLVSDWKDLMLNIYRQMGLHEEVVKYAEDLFQTGRNPIES